MTQASRDGSRATSARASASSSRSSSRHRASASSCAPPPGFDEGSRELHRDLSYLLRLWETIKHAAASKRAPALIYREHDLVLRNIRDYFTPDIDEIYIDNEEVCQRAREFLHDVMPGKEHVLHLYQGDQPIFSHFNVETQIESIYKRRVPLPSGGSIVVDGTEALTAIDVNSGRSMRGANQEETAVRTNVEAATEIARQLRLRDLGGLIVIDFIDMRSAQHACRGREDAARGHAPGQGAPRHRTDLALRAARDIAAAVASGGGSDLVHSLPDVRRARPRAHHRVGGARGAAQDSQPHRARGCDDAASVSLPPEVAVYLLNQKRDDLAQLERRYATKIQVVLNEALMPHQSEFEARTRVETGQPEVPQIRLGGVTPAEPPAQTAAAGNGDCGASPQHPSRRHGGCRRGRRLRQTSPPPPRAAKGTWSPGGSSDR